MRVIVFFDLPTQTLDDRREYRRFRKFLVKKGFLMLQESVYAKLALNQSASEALEKNVRDNKPKIGLVQMLTITEKQFSRMEYVVGEGQSNIIQTDARLVVI